jgi:hypothetical protein
VATARNFDEFLHQAYTSGVKEPDYEADSASAVEVPEALRQKVAKAAMTESSRLLAVMILEAGESAGWDEDELVQEVVGHESEARKLLAGKADPRSLSATGLARLFMTVGLPPRSWKQLLVQTVTGFVTFPGIGGQVLGRTSGLSAEDRASALGGSDRDPARARPIAEDFVEEVVEAWTSLTTMET